jgi:hypothetical protein
MREVSAHAQNDNRSAAAEIFAIGTYFPNSPRIPVSKQVMSETCDQASCMQEADDVVPFSSSMSMRNMV